MRWRIFTCSSPKRRSDPFHTRAPMVQLPRSGATASITALMMLVARTRAIAKRKSDSNSWPRLKRPRLEPERDAEPGKISPRDASREKWRI